MANGMIPVADADFILWMNDHAPVWAQSYAAIGLTQAKAAAFTSKVTDMNKGWTQYQGAKQALKDAAEAWRNTKAVVRDTAAEDVRIIKTFATQQADPNAVYSAAMIPPPKVPVQGTPPGQPTSVKANLDTVTGNLKLTFKCENPKGLSGTVYTVFRRAGLSGNWNQIGVTSTRSFVDTTLAAGQAAVQYQIVAQRGSVTGPPSNAVTVNFGRSATGETFVQSVKLAA